MVETGGGEVVGVAGGGDVVVHKFHGFRFLIVGADVHYLNAETFVDGEEFGSRTVKFFLLGGCCYRPIKIFAGDEIGQTQYRNPIECGFVGIINTYNAVLPPKTFERRYNVFVKTADAIVSFVTHFQRVSHGVENVEGVLVVAVPVVGIAAATYCNEVGRWYIDNLRLAGRKVIFFELFLEIKCHNVLNFKGLPSDSPR